MTVPIDTFINIAIGQGLALAAARQIRARRLPVLCESFGAAAFFAIACFAPLGLYLFWAYPDWSTMYWLAMSPARAATLRWLVPWLYVAACLGGYALAHKDIRAGHETRAWVLFGVALAIETAISLGGAPRLLRVGTLHQFREGTAPSLWQDPLGPLLVSVGSLFALALAFLVTRLLERGKTVPTASA
ncbi:MAG: hypothetical protein IPK07_23560 [Deltaproteobacteria bacterium]|nr:hypothetical protein [Deltaproteobacteria bacterium]